MKGYRLTVFLCAVLMLVVFSMCSGSSGDKKTSDDESASASDTPEGSGDNSGGGGGDEGSGGSGSAEDTPGSAGMSESAKGELNTSMTGFTGIMDGTAMKECMNAQKPNCNCPGGGTVTMGQGQAMTFTDCKNAAGTSLYSGTATMAGDPQSGGSLSGVFDKFGGCTGMTLEAITKPSCGGSMSGACAGEAFSCTISGTAGSCTCS